MSLTIPTLLADKSNLINMTGYVRELGTLDVSVKLEDSTVFGDNWVEKLSTQLNSIKTLTMKGIFDDTATTGPDVLWGPNKLGYYTTIVIGFTPYQTVALGSAPTSLPNHYWAFLALVMGYKVMAKVGTLTAYEADFEQTMNPASVGSSNPPVGAAPGTAGNTIPYFL